MEPTRVVYNNGHSKKDPGAIDVDTGQQESKTNYNVAVKCVDLGKARGWNTTLTNPNMVDMTPGARPRLANQLKAKAYISIHHNAGGGEYTLVLYQMNSAKSKLLAQCIADEFTKQYPGRKVKIGIRESVKYPGHDYFSDLSVATMPAVIVEGFFMDSDDIDLINTVQEQHTESACIDRGVAKFLAIK